MVLTVSPPSTFATCAGSGEKLRANATLRDRRGVAMAATGRAAGLECVQKSIARASAVQRRRCGFAALYAAVCPQWRTAALGDRVREETER